MRRGLWFTKYSKQICDVMDRGPSHHDAMVLLDMMSWRSWRTVQVHDWAFSREYSISRQSMQDPVAPRRWQKHYMPHRFRQDPAESRLLRNVRASSAVNFIKTRSCVSQAGNFDVGEQAQSRTSICNGRVPLTAAITERRAASRLLMYA